MATKKPLALYAGKIKELQPGDTLSTGGGGGGIVRSINVVVSTNTTAGSVALTDYVYFVSGTVTITLPTAVGNTNMYTIKNTGTGVVSIATTASQTIDAGAAPITITKQNNSLDFVSDGANFKLV